MIEESALSWPVGVYDLFVSEWRNPDIEVTLEQYSLSITTTVQAGVGTVSSDETLDAILCGDVIIRAWKGTDEVKFGRLLSEDSGDQSWTESQLSATDITIAPTLAVDGNTIRVYFFDGTHIRYYESTDKGASWGASQSFIEIGNRCLLLHPGLTPFILRGLQISTTSG